MKGCGRVRQVIPIIHIPGFGDKAAEKVSAFWCLRCGLNSALFAAWL